jgi:hypothetical protein
MSRIQNVLESLVRQNTQLKEAACGESSVLLKRLQQALSSNDNMRREIDYLKCMSSNVFCESTENDPTLGPLMHQHSVSIQTEKESDQILSDVVKYVVNAADGCSSSTHQAATGKPVIPSRKGAFSKEMLQIRSSIMAWMATTASKAFFAWKNVVWFGACVQSPQLDGTTMLVEIQHCGAFVARKLVDAVADVQSVCKQWSSSLNVAAGLIAKEKAVKDLGDKFFSNRSQIQLMISLSEQTTSLHYQNSFQTLQQNLMDEHKEILQSAQRSEEAALDLKTELVFVKAQNLEMQEKLFGFSNHVEELQQKLDDAEAKQLEWSTHVEATADVWAHQLQKLVEQDKAVVEQNGALRKLLVDSMGHVKTPLPQLVSIEPISVHIGASSLCSCSGCNQIKKRLQVVRSAALKLSAKFVGTKQAVFKAAGAFSRGNPAKEVPKVSVISPKKEDTPIVVEVEDDPVNALGSNGAQRTMFRVLKDRAKICQMESKNAKLQDKIDELQLLNDYLSTKLRNEETLIADRPVTAGRLDLKRSGSLAGSRQRTPKTPLLTSPRSPMSPFKSSFQSESLIIDASPAILNPSTASLKGSHQILQADQKVQNLIHCVPRLIKSAGSAKYGIEDSSASHVESLDSMLDAAHQRIDEMHREIMELRQQAQAFDKKSVEVSIGKAVQIAKLKMMTQVEQMIAQASDLRKELKEKEKRALIEMNMLKATFEAQQLLLSQQLSSARAEMSLRASTTINLRRKLETEEAKSKSNEAALISAQRSRENDKKIVQEINEEMLQLQIMSARATQQAEAALKRTHDEVMVEHEAQQKLSHSERELELLSQLSASEHVADAAVALSHHLIQMLTETSGNSSSMQIAAADAFKKAKVLGVELPFLVKSPWQKVHAVILENVDVKSSAESDEVSNRMLPLVRNPSNLWQFTIQIL